LAIIISSALAFTPLMIPDHCKDVSIRNVDFQLTRENIEANIREKKAYTRTDHIVLRNGNDLAVIKVIKPRGKDLFRPIIDYEIIALPDETVLVKDNRIDVLNPSHMARLVAAYPGKTVVVQGLFNHISFVKDLKPLRLRILDVVPPFPSKLGFLVEKALSSGYIEFPIVPEEEHINLNDLANEVNSEGIIFPCEASGLESNRKTYFLDMTPEIDVDCELIGCSLSNRIYQSVYKKEIKLIDICAWNRAPRDRVPTIVKCCKIKQGHFIDGNIAVVQWGASVREVTEAINALFGQWGD